MDQSKLD